MRIEASIKESFIPIQIQGSLVVCITDVVDPLRSSLTSTRPIELYILPKTLSAYFGVGPQAKKRIPLLLLRMFVGAARERGVKSDKEWVSLVTRICHGTAWPFNGVDNWDPVNNHWLKYDATSGGSSFVRPNTAISPNKNYSGEFLLSAWLWTYRLLMSKKKVVTLVNCYDQAGIVEIVLSLGMDPRKIAWEYHKPYGFIDAKLVG